MIVKNHRDIFFYSSVMSFWGIYLSNKSGQKRRDLFMADYFLPLKFFSGITRTSSSSFQEPILNLFSGRNKAPNP